MGSAGLLLGIILLVQSSTALLTDDQLSATPLPILSTTSSILEEPVSTEPVPTTTSTTPIILPEIGEGNSAQTDPTTTAPAADPDPTTTSSVQDDGFGSESPETDPVSTSSSSKTGISPGYKGSFYTKGTGVSQAGVSGANLGPGIDPLTGADDLVPGALAGEDLAEGNGSADSSSDAQGGTAAQDAPNPSYVAVPGPGGAWILVVLGAAALVVVRLRLA